MPRIDFHDLSSESNLVSDICIIGTGPAGATTARGIDFARRDWVAHSGWPFDLDHMRPYLERTPTYLGLGAGADYADDRFLATGRAARAQTGLERGTALLLAIQPRSREPLRQHAVRARAGRNLPDNVRLGLLSTGADTRLGRRPSCFVPAA